MRVQDNHLEETTEEARQGENIKGMTTVLRVSTIGAAAVLFLGAAAFWAWNAGWF